MNERSRGADHQSAAPAFRDTGAKATGELPGKAEGKPTRARVAMARRIPLHWARFGFVVAGLILLLTGVAIYLALPAGEADFRLHATTSFVAFRATSAFNINVDAREWRATIGPSNARGRSLSSVASKATSERKPESSDILTIAIGPNDVVEIQTDPRVPAGFVIALPVRPVTFSVQPASDAALTGRTDDGRETPVSTSDPVLEWKIGGASSVALHFTLPSCGAPMSTATAIQEDEAVASPPARAICAQDIGHRMSGGRMSVDQLGFGTPDINDVDAGLLDGGFQFLDHTASELVLYRGTDLRIGDVDAELTSLELKESGIAVFATGKIKEAAIVVKTHDGVTAHSIMPTRFDHLKGMPWIVIGTTVFAVVIGAVGLLLSIAGVIRPIARALHRFFGLDESASHLE
ncbi:hypothetical protein [Paraburkholderia sp. CI3]|uniref:hypothetical protein n=1 Tax=Paraburkholderia sp. CI3 TaxID=2991060 RepID=UPI003D2105E9